MELESEQYYQALLSRDERFDGLFFVAVQTTKIYCRPVCRVKPALEKNCTFYHSAAAAEQDGFRPCLKCRPELAPGFSLNESVSRLAALAYQHIEEGVLNNGSVADLADDLGVSERHLRRALRHEFGVSPVQLAQTQRLHLAKRLLTDTQLPVSDVAFASGFQSLRRFNALLKNRYRLSPSEIRKTTAKTSNGALVSSLAYRPPFAWSDILDFLRERACSGVELVSDHSYQRTVAIDGHRGTIEVTNRPEKNQLQVSVSLSLAPVLLQVLSKVKRLFDLNAEPDLIAQRLKGLAEKNPGLRLPGAFDGFEIALRAIVAQQISVKAATTLCARLMTTFGENFETDIEGLDKLSLKAEQIAHADFSDIINLGITRARAKYILEFSQAVASQKIRLEPDIHISRQITELKQISGIGEWTAQYIAMRALAWPDAFLHTDLGIYKALKTRNKKEILEKAESWRPWRGYANMHLWQTLKEIPEGK